MNKKSFNLGILVAVIILFFAGMMVKGDVIMSKNEWTVNQRVECGNDTNYKYELVEYNNTYLCAKVIVELIDNKTILVCYRRNADKGMWFVNNSDISLNKTKHETIIYERMTKKVRKKEIVKSCKKIEVYDFTNGKSYKTVNMTRFGKCTITDKSEIVCDSKKDGNADGKCKSGESCVKCKIVNDELQCYKKNSKKTFSKVDNTFTHSGEVIVK